MGLTHREFYSMEVPHRYLWVFVARRLGGKIVLDMKRIRALRRVLCRSVWSYREYSVA